MNKQDFLEKFSLPIIDSTRGTGLLPSVKMAQAILETGWGNSFVGSANNLFGIKATGKHTPYWKGDYVMATTKEISNGQEITIQAPFRSYKSIADSIKDHTYFLQQYNRYKPVFEAKTFEDQAQALQKAGYATATNYAKSLINLIKQNSLSELDKKKSL
jgi:flagellum-specific peptidoglycan hydrolase FlgJ